MSVRDEIARAASEAILWRGAWDRMPDAEREIGYQRADAILPIVERVAVQSIREALEEFGFDWSARKERDALECVRRVMEGGQCM